MVVQWYGPQADTYLANYGRLALIIKENKPYFKRSKTIPRIGILLNDTSKVENMKMADKLLTSFNFVTGITELDNVSSGLIIVMWIWLLILIQNLPHLMFGSQFGFKTRFLKRIKYYGEAHYQVCMILDPQVHGVGHTKLGVQLAIQHVSDLALHLFHDKEATINRTFLVEINNCMGNKHTFTNETSWAGLKEDPVAFWAFFKTNLKS